MQPAKYTELSAALQKNQEFRKRNLHQRKVKKFNWLKYKSNQQQTPRVGRQQEKVEPKNNNARSKNNERSRSRSRNTKPSYASVLKNKSNTEQRQANNIHITPTNPNRLEKIKKLEEQIQELRNQRNNDFQKPKTGGCPSRRGEHQPWINSRDVHKRRNVTHQKHHANIKRIRNAIGQPKFITDPSANIVNLSNKKFNIAEYNLLNKNLNFCPSPGKYNKKTFEKDIDAFTRRIKLKAHFNNINDSDSNTNN